MPSRAPDRRGAVRLSARRVAAPPTQARIRRLSPTYALAWLHLLPESAFPIRSRDDMAAKISALLFGRAPPAEEAGHALPAGAQPQPGRKRGAR